MSERLVIGWTCEDCNVAIGDEPRMWDLAEKFRKEHEEETGHTTTVKVVEEMRILPSQGDRNAIGESVLELAEERGDRIEWICPNCQRTGEELDTTERCPDCDERLREVIPDGGSLTLPEHGDKVVLAEEYEDISDDISQYVGVEGLVVAGHNHPLNTTKDRTLVHFDSNPTERPGGPRYWVKADALKILNPNHGFD